MSQTNTDSAKKRWAFYFIITFFIAFLSWGAIFIFDDDDDSIIIENGNFYSKIDISINKINRYKGIQQSEGAVGGMIAPRTANQEVDYFYLEDFENGTGDWYTEQFGQISQNQYEGDYSYRFRPYFASDYCELNLNKTFDINGTDTFDFVFYTLVNEYFDEGYFSFSFKASWIDDDSIYHEIPIRLIITESASNPYLSMNTSEIVLRQSIQEFTWTGFMLQDIRQLLLDYNHTTINGREIHLFDIGFTINEFIFLSVYLDYFRIQKTPFELTNLWFYGSLPISDYQVEIDYILRVNTSAILSLEDIILRIDVYRLIQNNVENIDYSLIDSISLENLTFNVDPLSKNYDQIAEGTYYGIIHSFPYWNHWGDQLYYSFNASVYAYAPLINGETAGDSLNKTLDNQDFNIEWKKIIDLD